MQSACTTSFEVNKSFRKKVVLPPLPKWKVCETDTLVSGHVQCIIRTKGLFFKHSSANLRRHATITKQGFMIIYSGETEGYVLDLPAALRVKAHIGFAKSSKQTRQCRIDVKMSFGTFCMLISGPEAEQWINAINKIVLGTKEKKGISASQQSNVLTISEDSETVAVKAPGATTPSVISLLDEEGVLSLDSTKNAFFDTPMDDSFFDESIWPTETEQQQISEYFLPVSIVVPLEDSTRSKSPVTVIEKKPVITLGELEAAWRRPPVDLPSTLSSETDVDPDTEPSVRCGPLSVATLRQKLESKARCSWRKTRRLRRPTMLEHPLVPIQNEAPQTSAASTSAQAVETTKPRLIAKKAASAPAALPSTGAISSSSRKSLAKISYDGCFDSIRA